MSLLEAQLPSDHQSVAYGSLQRPHEGRPTGTLQGTDLWDQAFQDPLENQDLICTHPPSILLWLATALSSGTQVPSLPPPFARDGTGSRQLCLAVSRPLGAPRPGRTHRVSDAKLSGQ